MNTMITIGEYTFPFEQAVFIRESGGYRVQLQHLTEGEDAQVGAMYILVFDDETIEAIDFYLERHAVNLVQWKAKMKENEHKRNQHP